MEGFRVVMVAFCCALKFIRILRTGSRNLRGGELGEIVVSTSALQSNSERGLATVESRARSKDDNQLVRSSFVEPSTRTNINLIAKGSTIGRSHCLDYALWVYRPPGVDCIN